MASATARALAARTQDYASTAWQYLRHMTTGQWLWVGVIALGAILRFWGLGAKPLHHDESMHAFYSYMFARNPSGYEYDPLLHGPFQFHAVGIFFAIVLAFQHLFGAGGAAGNPWINDTTARIVPALFGVGIVMLPLGLRRELGKAGALITALLLAVSPSFVYFSRFLREDIYFNFFMFAMVVCAVRFAHDRKLRWLVACIAATVLAYATFEGIYLSLVLFVSYLMVLLVWELAHGLANVLPKQLTERERHFFSRAGLLLLLGMICSLVAFIGLHTLNQLSATINSQQAKADAQVQRLEDITALVLLYLCVFVAVAVIATLLWQVSRDSARVQVVRSDSEDETWNEDTEAPAPRGLRRWLVSLRERINPEAQPFLRLIFSTSWEHLFVAAVAGWMIFVALYWVIPPGPLGNLTWSQGFMVGIGRGIWQGLYYWLQQQQVARGGQPVYYYFLLLPLYEQLVAVFGLIGAVYALVRPTRFRLFLVWWAGGSLVLYSWAGEKMPWLSIHILLPLVLLAGLVFNWIWQECALLAREFLAARVQVGQPALAGAGGVPVGGLGVLQTPALLLSSILHKDVDRPKPSAPRQAQNDPEGRGRESIGRRPDARRNRSIVAVAGAIAALLLFVPMVHSMWLLSYKDAADGPVEMMVYVQTTNDVDLIMNKITQADKATHAGQHQLRIWVGEGEEWPFYWYLRDFYLDPHPGYYAQIPAKLTAPFSDANPAPDALILLPSDAQTFLAAHPNYKQHQYKLRSWWDEAYKPLPCQATAGHPCPASANWGAGVGPANYLSYGSYPPPNARFDLGRAAGRLWNWLWQRQPLGETG
ncbi:MAG TPA: flippase activity-associated protein Agl23, partial [Ktedonobacterales bacterium]|nr:flippase activity-associated protein Agl23 [Ktedonobacterales bacterium]